MTLLTIIEIATNYANGDVEIMTVKHKETEKWTSLLYLMRDGNIHKLMISFDINDKFLGWDTEDEAKKKMQELVDMAIETYDEKFNKDF